MTISRREFLQAAAAAGLVLVVDIVPAPASELPSATSVPAYGHGIDFDGILGGIYITPTDRQTDAWAEVWVVTRPKGTLLIHHAFSQMGGWYWLANPGEHIVGPVNVACSVDADILLAGMP